MKKRLLRSWVLRALAFGLLSSFLLAPAPGNVGGCGAANPVADIREHCVNTKFWMCRRDLAAGRTTMEEYTACLEPIDADCGPAASWPAGCAPTQSQSDACVTLLSRVDFLPFTTEELLRRSDDCDLCQ